MQAANPDLTIDQIMGMVEIAWQDSEHEVCARSNFSLNLSPACALPLHFWWTLDDVGLSKDCWQWLTCQAHAI